MIIIETIDEIDNLNEEKAFIPTMGALHAGHISLVNRAKEFNLPIWMSIFVNKLQFNETNDFNTYPRDIERDIGFAKAAGVDVLFIPSDEYVYRNRNGVEKDYALSAGDIGKKLEGRSRLGHFDGVLNVVDRLLIDVQPRYSLLGRKDAQQFFIVSTMLKDRHNEVRFIACPIIREDNGLALSSRNSLLSNKGKKAANCLFRTLSNIAHEKDLKPFLTQSILDEQFYSEKAKGVKLDYIAFVDANSFGRTSKHDYRFSNLIEVAKEFYILIAAEVEGVRLIDNMFIRYEGGESLSFDLGVIKEEHIRINA